MWKILPLEGKYYGTIIEEEVSGDQICIWLSLKTDKYDASFREKAEGWTKEDGFDHVETQESYDVALAIKDMLNEVSKTSK